MGETSLIPGSGTQAPSEAEVKKLTVEMGESPLFSGHTSVDVNLFPVRAATSATTILIRLDIDLLKRQQEIEKENEEIRRRLHG